MQLDTSDISLNRSLLRSNKRSSIRSLMQMTPARPPPCRLSPSPSQVSSWPSTSAMPSPPHRRQTAAARQCAGAGHLLAEVHSAGLTQKDNPRLPVKMFHYFIGRDAKIHPSCLKKSTPYRSPPSLTVQVGQVLYCGAVSFKPPAVKSHLGAQR
jgi:hypothetical protein